MKSTTALMREYLIAQMPIGAPVFRAQSTSELTKSIESLYEGGIIQWRADYLGQDLHGEENSELRLRAMVSNDLGFRLQECDRIVGLQGDFGDYVSGDKTATLTIETIIVEESFGRMREVTRYLRVFRNEGGCYLNRGYGRGIKHGEWLELINVEDPTFVGQAFAGQYTVLNTPERFASKIYEYLECARPGTSSHPLDAPSSPERERSDWDVYYSLARLAPEHAARYMTGE